MDAEAATVSRHGSLSRRTRWCHALSSDPRPSAQRAAAKGQTQVSAVQNEDGAKAVNSGPQGRAGTWTQRKLPSVVHAPLRVLWRPQRPSL